MTLFDYTISLNSKQFIIDKKNDFHHMSLKCDCLALIIKYKKPQSFLSDNID